MSNLFQRLAMKEIKDLTGATVGQYQIAERLGSGGMAVVYRAMQPSLGREVALKVLSPALVHQEGFTQRFENEARTLARLDHPHILPVFDFGIVEGITFIATPLVRGGTLKNMLTGQALPLAVAWRYMSAISDGLHHAHEVGVIHRDLKPSNVLLHADGRPLLGDFGLARPVEAPSGITLHGFALGTPGYMSPEQAMGAPLDRRTDVYSLGVLAFEMLTGSRPYVADNATDLVRATVYQPVPSACSRNNTLPIHVDSVLARALAKDPNQRPLTALQFNHELTVALMAQYMNGQQAAVAPMPAPAPAPSYQVSNPAPPSTQPPPYPAAIQTPSPPVAPPAYGGPGGQPVPAYGPVAPAPVYGQPAPTPVYGQPAPMPGYGQPTPGYGQPAPTPGYGQPAPPNPGVQYAPAVNHAPPSPPGYDPAANYGQPPAPGYDPAQVQPPPSQLPSQTPYSPPPDTAHVPQAPAPSAQATSPSGTPVISDFRIPAPTEQASSAPSGSSPAFLPNSGIAPVTSAVSVASAMMMLDHMGVRRLRPSTRVIMNSFFSRILKSAYEASGEEWANLLTSGGLQEYAYRQPPDNGERGIPADHLSQLASAFDNVFGAHSGEKFRALGRLVAERDLDRDGSSKKQQRRIRLIPASRRLAIVLNQFAVRLDEVRGEHLHVTKQIDSHRLWLVFYDNPLAHGRARKDKGCEFWIAALEALLRWAGLANDWMIEEVECGCMTATGDCVFAIRTPDTL